MSMLESALKKLASFQYDHHKAIAMITLIFTIFMAVGVTNISMQTDFNKEMPQDLPIFKLSERVSDTFGGQDVVMVLVQLDSDSNIRGAPKDIRDPRVIQSLIDLEEQLGEESSIDSMQSVGTVFSRMGGVPDTLEGTKAVLDQIPEASGFFNKDYTATIFFAYSSGASEEKIKSLTRSIKDNIDQVSKPAGVKMTVTGTLQIRDLMLDLLQSDAVYTISVAAIFIFLVIFSLERTITKSILVFTPLMLGLIWTMGTMGLLDMKLSVATVGIGAMILGLGVEYGVFIVTRYTEERDSGNSQKDALLSAIPHIGSAITGSVATTIAGFLSLTVSIMPMMQHLGITLALGIFYCMLAALVVTPALIILEEKYEYWQSHRKHAKYTKKVEHHSSKTW